MRAFLLLCAVVVLASASVNGISINELVNVEVERTIDLTTNNAKVSLAIKVENKGDSADNTVFFALPKAQVAHLSYVTAKNKSGKVLAVSLDVKPKNGNKDAYYFTVTLKKAVESGGSSKFNVEMMFTSVYEAVPAEIVQGQSQLVKYFDNHYFYSPYLTLDQSTTVNLASARIEKRSDLSPSDAHGDTVTYGPYENIAAHSENEMMIHFENNFAMMTMDEYIREIEVSHWGNVAVEEHIKVRNSGAALKGSFSRHDFSRKKEGAVASFRRTTAIVPLDAADFYFRDFIGNISSSSYRWMNDHIALNLDHRFPMFGGWKTDFYYGYNLPVHKFLFTNAEKSDEFVLTTKFGPVFRDVHVKQLVVKVILPEGATNIRAHVPFGVDSTSLDVRHTYLDTQGRPVLVLVKNNAVHWHNVDFSVTYEFSSSHMMTEPLMVMFAFFTIFVVAMLYQRTDMSIAVGTQSYEQEAQQREFMLSLLDVLSQHETAYHALDKAVTAGNADAADKAEAAMRRTTTELLKLVEQASKINEASHSKAKDVMKKDKEKSEAQAKFHQAVRRGQAKEIHSTKDAYLIAEDEFARFVSDMNVESNN